MTTKKTTTKTTTPPAPLGERIINVMQQVKYLQKDKVIEYKGVQYSAITHDAVTAAIREAVIDNGIIPSIRVSSHEFHHDLRMTMMEVVLTLFCADDLTKSISHTGWGYGQDFGDKGPGKALSYAVKNIYLKAFLLETGEDEESRVAIPDTGPISEEQLTKLQDMMDVTDTDEKDIVGFVNKDKGLEIKSLAELPKNLYRLIEATLEKKAKMKEEKDAD